MRPGQHKLRHFFGPIRLLQPDRVREKGIRRRTEVGFGRFSFSFASELHLARLLLLTTETGNYIHPENYWPAPNEFMKAFRRLDVFCYILTNLFIESCVARRSLHRFFSSSDIRLWWIASSLFFFFLMHKLTSFDSSTESVTFFSVLHVLSFCFKLQLIYAKHHYSTAGFLRCFRDPIRAPRIKENRVPRTGEIGFLQVHTGYQTVSLNNFAIILHWGSNNLPFSLFHWHHITQPICNPSAV